MQEPQLPIARFELPIAVPADRRLANAASAIARHLPRFIDLPETALGSFGRAALVSGGPSAADHLDTIRKFSTIIAAGSAGAWLIENGIFPAYCVICDPKADHAKFYRIRSDQTLYLVSSNCDPSVFDMLEGVQVRLWHPFDNEIDPAAYDNEPRIAGGCTVSLKAIALAHIMGYRELHLFGMDGSFRQGAEHAYPYDQDRPAPLSVNYNGRQFMTTPQLLQQTQDFLAMYFDHQHELSCKLYGDGLCAFMMKESSLFNLEPLDA